MSIIGTVHAFNAFGGHRSIHRTTGPLFNPGHSAMDRRRSGALRDGERRRQHAFCDLLGWPHVLARFCSMSRAIDHVGKRWAMLTAVSYVNHGKNGARWVFHCHQCGTEKIMPVRFVRNGRRTSCGCKATIGAPEIGPQQSLMNAVAWPFPRVVGRDGSREPDLASVASGHWLIEPS